jgi:hypothetical protein
MSCYKNKLGFSLFNQQARHKRSGERSKGRVLAVLAQSLFFVVVVLVVTIMLALTAQAVASIGLTITVLAKPSFFNQKTK